MPWYYFLIIGICLFLSAFFSAADMVYSVVNKDRLERKIEKGSKLAKLALKLASDYDFSISSILFGNNVANIFASSFATLVGIALNNENFTWGETLVTIILTIVIIIFCEFVPKAFAKRFSDSLSIAFSVPVTMFKYLTIIFVWPIAKLFSLVGKLFTKKSKEEKEIDEDVLTEMVDTIEEEGILDEDEADLVRSAIDFGDIQAFEIMTPRVDVFALDVEDSIYDYINDEEDEFFVHSRIPVYEDTIDNIIGVVNIKSLAPYILKHEEVNLRSLMYEPLMIPRNTQVLDLLRLFKEKKVHIAIVIDEYGGTEGIVTMEDILEEIVGDIFDENDVVDEQFIDKGHGDYIFDGAFNIDDAFELIGYDNEELDTDYTTIGGFCQEVLGRFAKVGDQFDFEHYHFIILEADEFTVIKLEIIDLIFEEEKE